MNTTDDNSEMLLENCGIYDKAYIPDFPDDKVSLERFNYAAFSRMYTSYKYSDIANKLVNINNSKFQLPNRSTLHLCNHFLDHNSEDYLPDFNNPLIRNEQFVKTTSILSSFAMKKSTPFKVTDRSVFKPSRFVPLLKQAMVKNKEIQFKVNDASAVSMMNNLHIKDYTFLLTSRFFGRMVPYKNFEFLMRSMFNYIINDGGDRNHYIYLPVNDTVYTRTTLLMATKKITVNTLKGITDYSFYLQLLICGFVHGFFENAENVQPFEWDNGTVVTSTSILSQLPENILPKINFIIVNGDDALIYNLADLKRFSKNPALFNAVIKHFALLKKSNAGDNDLLDSNNNTDDLDIKSSIGATKSGFLQSDYDIDNTAEEGGIDDTIDNDIDFGESSDDYVHPGDVNGDGDGLSDTNENEFDEQSSPDSIEEDEIKDDKRDKDPTGDEVENKGKVTIIHPQELNKVTFSNKYPKTPYISNMEKRINLHLQKVITDKSQLKRAQVLAEKQMDVQFGGVPIGELLSVTIPPLKEQSLDYLENVVSDKTMLKSSIQQFDKVYIQSILKSDMAKTITAFSDKGFFVRNVIEKVTDTPIDKKITYTVQMVDIYGKAHNPKFTIPTLDDDGNMMLNGISSKRVKQMANNPICKVSDYRVNLLSDYNKTIVERTKSRLYSFESYILNYFNKTIPSGIVTYDHGSVNVDSTIKLPYEYSVIMKNYSAISFGEYGFNFEYNDRVNLGNSDTKRLEKQYGIFCSSPSDVLHYCFWGENDLITVVDKKTLKPSHTTRFLSLMNSVLKDHVKLPPIKPEFATIKILDKVFPIILMFGYQYGLQNTLDYMNIDYDFIPSGKRVLKKSFYDIIIPFKDGNLVFNRYPFYKSLVIAGLVKFDTKNINFMDMNTQDAYYRLLVNKGISINYLKGIHAFFELFMDPITVEVLQELKEPTNVRDLLLRAVFMISTTEHYPTSSMRHYRLRGYDRVPGVVYNEMSRAMARYITNTSPNKTFSINPEAVYLNIIQDNTVLNNDVINPVYEVRVNSQVSFGGKGGRTSQAFVTRDRVFPDDAVGIMSEATPDNGKVAMTINTSADPRIANLRGKLIPNDKNEEKLSAMETLSIVGNLMPGLTQDDTKRVNYTSIQLGHHVPNMNGDVSRIRTGYEKVLAQHNTSDFAIHANADCQVVNIDDATKTLKVQYSNKVIPVDGSITTSYKVNSNVDDEKLVIIFLPKSRAKELLPNGVYSLDKHRNFKVMNIYTPSVNTLNVEDKLNYETVVSKTNEPVEAVVGYIKDTVIKGDTEVFQYGSRYTSVSGSYMHQELVLNTKVGEKLKRGDILIYNKGFFVNDPYSKQVSWKHGVNIKIALMTISETLEDGCIISKKMSEAMTMQACHSRNIVIDRNTAIYNVVLPGTKVSITDKLCDLIASELDSLSSDASDATLDFLNDLNKRSPESNYSSEVVDLKMYYSGDMKSFHKTTQSLGKQLKRYDIQLNNFYENSISSPQNKKLIQVETGTKFKGVDFIDGTIMLEFMLEESIPAKAGDKLCVMNANKTIISSVLEKPIMTTSGVELDMVFSTDSFYNRIVNSPFINGVASRVLEKIEDDILELYFT